MMRTLRHALGVGVLVAAAVCGCGSETRSTPSERGKAASTPASVDAPAAPALPAVGKRCGTSLAARAMTYRATDGAVLTGAVLGSGDVGVIVANSWSRDLCEWLSIDDSFVRSLVRSGYRVLLFDYRGTGLTPPPRRAAARRYDADVAGGAALLRHLGVRRIALVGGSLGGIIALAAGPEMRPRPSAIVSLSGSGFAGTNTGPDYGNLDGRAAVRRLRVPVQFIVATDDTESLQDARALYSAAASRDKRLLTVSGGAHSSELMRPDLNDSAAKVRAAAVGFIRQYAPA